MPVSGLVVTLRGDQAERAATISKIAGRSAFTLGEAQAHWLPIVLEAVDDAESRHWHDWLMTLPGVGYVDVVAVNFSDARQGALQAAEIISQ